MEVVTIEVRNISKIIKSVLSYAILCIILTYSLPASSQSYKVIDALKRGVQAEKSNDHATALTYYQMAANSGSGEAEYLMGYIYKDKLMDYPKAIFHYKEALRKGRGKDDTADSLAASAVALAYMYALGDGFAKPSYIEAARYMRMAAAAGDPGAIKWLKNNDNLAAIREEQEDIDRYRKSKAIGDYVCSYFGAMGYVERIAGNKLQVRVQHYTVRALGSPLVYDEMVWVNYNEVYVCN